MFAATWILLLAAADPAPPFRVYVADLDAASVTLAWGTASGVASNNTIGKGAAGSGPVLVKIDGRSIASADAWVKVEGLRPDTVYPYSIVRNGVDAARGAIRTWPAQSTELTFFVIGDFGNGKKHQHELGRRMEEERLKLEQSGVAVRFVVTTGDNIYGKLSASGKDDRDWEKKFFEPYAATLAAIPFKAVLGNHDGDESENPADLAVCLDNFFMPGRWYSFTYGSFAEFLALDSTRNRDASLGGAAFAPGGEQTKWLAETAAKPAPPWRMAVLHHPMFTAGPEHKPALGELRHWFEIFRKSDVRMVFSGHEHNLQFSERNEATGGMQFVVSGAGGQLRRGNIRRKMAKEHIRASSSSNHFLVVRIQGENAAIQPVGIEPVQLLDVDGKPVKQPVPVQQR